MKDVPDLLAQMTSPDAPQQQPQEPSPTLPNPNHDIAPSKFQITLGVHPCDHHTQNVYDHNPHEPLTLIATGSILPATAATAG